LPTKALDTGHSTTATLSEVPLGEGLAVAGPPLAVAEAVVAGSGVGMVEEEAGSEVLGVETVLDGGLD